MHWMTKMADLICFAFGGALIYAYQDSSSDMAFVGCVLFITGILRKYWAWGVRKIHMQAN